MEPTDAEIRALAREILDAEAYARWRQPRGVLEKWFDELSQRISEAWRALADWLARVFPDSEGGASLDESWLIFLFCLFVGTALGFLAVYGIRREPRAAAPGAEPAEDFEKRMLAEASQLDRAGRSLEAAHVVQLAVLEVLIRRGWLTLERSEPNVTLRRRLDSSALRPDARRELVALIDRLERAWFRDRRAANASTDLYGGWLAFYRELQAGGSVG